MLALAVLALAVAAQLPPQGHWQPLAKAPAPGVVDVVGPRADGRLVISTRSGLFLLRPGHPARRFAPGYAPKAGEPYAALAPSSRVRGAGCSFKRDDLYVIEPTATPGVARIDSRGRAHRFADLPAGSFPSGIAFDTTGRFGFRMLIAVGVGPATNLYAFDCRGRARVITRTAPRVEGGMAVAPASFGRFAGAFIAADESSGRILAIGARGQVRLVAQPPLPAGGDVGVESVGFVPLGFNSRGAAYMTDLGSPGSPTSGTDSVLVLRGRELERARLRPGELVVATEASARTVAVRCARRCTVRRVGIGPAATHGEGHITFVPRRSGAAR